MLGFDALGRLALAEIPRAAQNIVLSAASGSYAVTGYTAGFKTTAVPASGVYLVTGHDAQRVDWWKADSGVYSLAGHDAGLRLGSEAGFYRYDGGKRVVYTGADGLLGFGVLGGGPLGYPGYPVFSDSVSFAVNFVASGGSYAVTLGDFELRRTGYDYPPDQYGIGHIKLAMEEARRLSRVVKPKPYPVVRQLPMLRIPHPVPVQVAPVQGLIDNSDIIDRIRAVEQAEAAQREATTRMQARNRAVAVLLLAA